MNKFILFLLALVSGFVARAGEADRVTVAVISINDFHSCFVRNDFKQMPGAAALWQTIDSLKAVYPHSVVVSAGDNFGGSYFHQATRGQLIPEFFQNLGITLSAVGNHEFDEGQAALADKWRSQPFCPKDWQLEYVCANVRDAAGKPAPFAAPFSVREIPVGAGKSVKVAFIGLLTSSTPRQASVSKLKGLSFDGRYDLVLDSLKQTPDYAPAAAADIRVLLTHIGTEMQTDDEGNARPVWVDADVPHLQAVAEPTVQAWITSHTHETVCGRINDLQYPVLQAASYGRSVGVMKFVVDTTDMRLVSVTPEVCAVNPDIRLGAKQQRFQQKIDSVLQHTKTKGGAALKEVLTKAPVSLQHSRDDKLRQTEMGQLVCRSYAEAYRRAAGVSEKEPVIGVSHFGSIRCGFSEGDVTVLDVGDALPFANSLKAYRLTGAQIRKLIDCGVHNEKFGWIQTSSLNIGFDGDMQLDGLIYVSPSGKEIEMKDDKTYILVADDYMTHGGDNYDPAFFPEEAELKVEMPTTTDAFINYLRTLPELPQPESDGYDEMQI